MSFHLLVDSIPDRGKRLADAFDKAIDEIKEEGSISMVKDAEGYLLPAPEEHENE